MYTAAICLLRCCILCGLTAPTALGVHPWAAIGWWANRNVGNTAPTDPLHAALLLLPSYCSQKKSLSSTCVAGTSTHGSVPSEGASSPMQGSPASSCVRSTSSSSYALELTNDARHLDNRVEMWSVQHRQLGTHARYMHILKRN
jgi:hypothetical protein